MNRSVCSALSLLALTSVMVIAGCGGGSSSPPPPPQVTHFSVTAPASATAGTSVSFTVTALDASNSTVTSYAGTVHFTSSDPQAALPANSTLTNGTGTFSATLKSAGGQTIAATDTVTAVTNGTSNSVTVAAATTAHLLLAAPANVAAGATANFAVNAVDTFNNGTSYSGTVRFTSTDPQAVLPANSALSNGAGGFTATLKTLGGQTITATDTITASITGTSNSINVVSNTGTHFSFVAPPSVTAQKPFNFTVNALDAANNPAPGYSGTVHFTSTDPAAVLPADGTLTNGTVTASATLKTTGRQTITVTDTVTASITGTSGAIGVFTTCGAAGQLCGAAATPPCCKGLSCVAQGDRFFCEPGGQTLEDDLRFAEICSMGTARESHTATLLGNGLVLVTGGDDKTASLATAEMFNPGTRSFAPTGDMAYARTRHAATLLASGEVLVIGGRDAGGEALATAELFDPARWTFAPAASMSTARESLTATLLGNGKVLIAGGDSGAVTLATAELFDPTSGTFEPVGGMGSPRDFHTATLLRNGKVLVTGGRDPGGNVLATAELFDPASGSFMPAGTMSAPRESHTATLLGDGGVLIAGGDNGTTSLATAEIFDPTTGRFTPTGSMHAAREFHTATLRNDGTVVVAGGENFTSVANGSTGRGFLPESTALTEMFDPATGRFTPTGSMGTSRSAHTATLLPDGTMVLIGGVDDQIVAAHIPVSRVLKTAELFQ
jgi:hypothetical protein